MASTRTTRRDTKEKQKTQIIDVAFVGTGKDPPDIILDIVDKEIGES